VHLDLNALLKGQVHITELKLIKPEFAITRLENGTWNIEVPKHEKSETAGSPFLPSVFNIEDGLLILRDGENFMEIEGAWLTVRDMILLDDNSQPLLSRLSVTGDFSCRELRWNKLIISDFTSHLQGTKGSFIFDPVIFKALEGTAKGKIEADMGAQSSIFATHLELSRFKVEDIFSSLSNEELVRGEMDMTGDLATKGENAQELLRSMSGNVTKTGQNLIITKLDLDTLLEEYMHSQQFNLVDLGAFAIIGPLGPALTKGYDFSGVLEAANGGSTEVRQLVSIWSINEGKATARDVALATRQNRIAINGEVDFVAERFRNLVVAVIDAKGCAVVSQEVNGPFDSPEVKEPDFIKSAAGPFINIFKKATSFITKKEKECEVIYKGSVAAPSE
jgi:AsmA protein